MPNRLAGATSPYLLQHADNPVDWWEWSDAAFEEAARRDVPVLLSVGYAACHWCHVMAHESFEDAATAEQINAGFVAVKVDREERPDIDAVYMAATQAMTGQGGWPMTCFLTPAGRAVPLRHLLPDGALPAAARRRHAGVDRATVRGCAAPQGRSRPSWPTTPPRHCRRRSRRGGAGRRRAGTGRRVRRGERRVRRRAEVPAVDDAGVPAAPPRAHGLGAGAAHGDGDGGADGPRRHVRPARGRFRPLQRGRALGRAALREDALRQRAAAAGLRPPARIAGPASAAGPAGGGGDRGVPAAATCARRRAGSPRRWTPTRTASRV